MLFGCGDDESNGDAGEKDAGIQGDDAGDSDASSNDGGATVPESSCAKPYAGTPWKSADLLKYGEFEAGKVQLKLLDPTRTIPANDSYPGADERELSTTIWYPATADDTLAEGGPFPLLVWSHGFTSSGGEVSYLAEVLASRGYVVAAPTFPLSSLGAPGGATSEDFQNQPADISFVIDTMLAKSADASDLLAGAIDAERIAAGGLSMGASVTLFVSFHGNVRDPRIKAAVVLAGSGLYYQPSFFETRNDLPLFVMHGDLDAVIPYEPSGIALRDRTGSPTWFMTIKKGTHAGFARYTRGIDGNPDALGCTSIAAADPNRPSADDTLTRLGGEEVGIVVPASRPMACTVDPLPASISATRQQDLTVPVVYAFLESVLAKDEDQRNAGCQYVERDAVEQNKELEVVWR